MIDFAGFGAEPLHEAPLEGDIIVRQSTMESMQLCPARVGYSMDPTTSRVSSPQASFGTLVHAMIEASLNGMPERELLLTHQIFELWQAAERDSGLVLADVASSALLESMMDEARHAFTTWLDEVWDKEVRWHATVAVEQGVTIPLGLLDDRAVWLHGTPDLVLKSEVHDWKTSGRPWSEGKGLVRPQSSVYAVLSRTINPSLPRPFLFRYWVWDRKGKAWTAHDVWVDEHAEEAVKLNAWQYAKQIAARAFPATPAGESYGKFKRGWHCSAKWCDAWDVCVFKAQIPDDVDLNEKRSHLWD